MIIRVQGFLWVGLHIRTADHFVSGLRGRSVRRWCEKEREREREIGGTGSNKRMRSGIGELFEFYILTKSMVTVQTAILT